MDKFKAAWPIMRRILILMLQSDAMPAVDLEKVKGFMGDLDTLADSDGDGIPDAMESAGEVDTANTAFNPPDAELPPGYVWAFDNTRGKWAVVVAPTQATEAAPGHGF